MKSHFISGLTICALSLTLVACGQDSAEDTGAAAQDNEAPGSQGSPSGSLTRPADGESGGTLSESGPSGGATPAEAPPASSTPPEDPLGLDASGRRSVYSGVFTAEQAERGEKVQQEVCLACHTPDDWAGGAVLTGFTGLSALDLVNRLRTTMPLDAPGTLTFQQYTDVAALIFHLNGAPAGDEELPTDEAALRMIRLEYRR